jgi:hypothetical protein
MDGEMLALGHSLAVMLYVLGCLFQTLPIPYASIKIHGPQLMRDGVISEISLLSVSVITLLVSWISQMFSTAVQMPVGPDAAFVIITSQLSALEAAILLLIGSISSTVFLAPLAFAISSMTSSILTFVTVALIIWLIVKAIGFIITSSWLSFYIFGLLIFALPFRIGRGTGAMFMAASIVAAIAIPIMPSVAIWLQGNIGSQSLSDIDSTISQIRNNANPILVIRLVTQIPEMIGNLMVSVVVSLILFPFAYLLILSMVTRSVARLLGGSSGTSVSSFVLTPAWDLGSKVR